MLQAVRVRWLGVVTFSVPMPLVIDMTLAGPLNLGPETPTGGGNRWKPPETLINLTLSTFSQGELCMEPSNYDPDSKGYQQGLTGSRYPTEPNLFFNYPTRPVPNFENDRVAGN